MTSYFSRCGSVADVKREYRNLAFANHPDFHNTESARYTKIMQAINEAYHDALLNRDNEVSMGTDDKEHTYRYNERSETGVVDAVARLIRMQLPGIVRVTIVGIFIWIEGVTRQDKGIHKQLREGKFRYHSKRKVWYWKPSTYHARYNKRTTLSGIKAAYGAQELHKEDAAL